MPAPGMGNRRAWNNNQKKVFCFFCGNSKMVSPSVKKAYKKHFCNSRCKGDWQSDVGYLKGNKSPMRKEKYAKKLRGKGNGRWSGGKYKSCGYVMVYSPDHPRVFDNVKPYVGEHILVMEEHIGRLLEDDEVVHHINGKKDDNRIENLFLTNNRDHSYIHSLERDRDSEGRFI